MSLLALRDKNPLFNGRRKISLYSDFRKLKERNTDGYEANITAWKSFLLSILDLEGSERFKTSSFVLSINEDFISELYDPEYGRPLAFDVVVDELVQEQTLIPKSTYLTRTHSIYQGDGITSWLVERLFDRKWHSGNGRGGLVSEDYVIVKELDSMAGKVWSNLKVSSYSRSLYTKNMVYEFLENVLPDRNMVDLVLKYLARDKPRLQISGDVIKTSTDKPIDDQDIQIAQLCDTIHRLSKKVDNISERVKADDQKCKASLAEGNKPLAKYYLRSKRMAEKTQEDCLSKLENLEYVLTKIDGADEDVRIIAAIEDGTAILKSIQLAIGGVDRVEHLVDEFREQAVSSDEISQQLHSIRDTSVIEDGALEEELKSMEEQERSKDEKAIQKKLDSLPVVRESLLDEVNQDLSDQLSSIELEDVADNKPETRKKLNA